MNANIGQLRCKPCGIKSSRAGTLRGAFDIDVVNSRRGRRDLFAEPKRFG